MFTHTIQRNWSRPGESIVKGIDLTAGQELNIDEAIPAATTDYLVAFVLDVSQAKLIYMVSDVSVTIETNSAGSPINLFTLAANVPYVWAYGDAAKRDTAGTAITTDITALYVTNADAEDEATLQIRTLVDPTV